MFDASDSHRLYPQWLADYSRVKPGVDNPELISGSAKSDNFSPVMLEHIDTARFPLFDKQRAIRCTIQPGDILFMPAYTWHHVYSWTDKQAFVNAGVNYWCVLYMHSALVLMVCRIALFVYDGLVLECWCVAGLRRRPALVTIMTLYTKSWSRAIQNANNKQNHIDE